MDLLLRQLSRHRDIGLLILRVGLGAIFVTHGLGKLLEGTSRWESLGGSLQAIGLPVLGPPMYWGFAASITEFMGGILLILGFLFRPALVALLGTMVVATLFLLIGKNAPFTQWSHPLTVGWVFMAMLLIGPGRLSLDGEPYDTEPQGSHFFGHRE